MTRISGLQKHKLPTFVLVTGLKIKITSSFLSFFKPKCETFADSSFLNVIKVD